MAKLVAIDIDGTLLTSAQMISPATRAAIREVLDRGVRVVLVTGRSFPHARPFAEELGLTTPLILHNGALVKDVAGRVFDARLLDAETAREIIGRARAQRMDLIAFDDPDGDGQAVVETIAPENERLRRYLSRWQRPAASVPDLWRYVDHPVLALTTVDRWEKACRFADAIEREFRGRARVWRTEYPRRDMALLDFVSPESSKARALDRLARRWDIAPSEIMVVGDNRNDVEMFAYAGLGVVMGNAEEELKALGDYVTGTNDEDGLAQALRRFVLGEVLS
ncbi:5-amino-6-(5-phospho-D-ribitylamino)uracil phosphatase YcsE [bacterium HR08]|nr:5-amino-6-(5-phospho-D-ribitylamino)uracil phosphatase YcsE [bacterium HR08]